MKYVGILFVLFAAIIVSRDYSSYMQKRSAECKDFLAFIAHMRIQVGCFLRPVKKLGEGFSSPALEKSGFLDSLSESERILDAYKNCEANLSLSAEEKNLLTDFFSSFGEGYLDEGVKLIESSYSGMERLYQRLCEEKAKNTKLVTSLSVTLALGIIIFMI